MDTMLTLNTGSVGKIQSQKVDTLSWQDFNFHLDVTEVHKIINISANDSNIMEASYCF